MRGSAVDAQIQASQIVCLRRRVAEILDERTGQTIVGKSSAR